MLVYIGTLNTTSGNPRRGWIIDYGSADAWFVDEGYMGRGALRVAGVAESGDVQMLTVTPSQYRYWLGLARS